jgi:hypothetical protein
LVEIAQFDSNHAFIKSKVDSLCVTQVNSFLICINEAVKIYKDRNAVLKYVDLQMKRNYGSFELPLPFKIEKQMQLKRLILH